MGSTPEYNRSYYLKNKDKINAKNKLWAEKNQERLKAYRKSYWENPENKARKREQDKLSKRRYRKRNPGKESKYHRIYMIKKKYGIESHEYESMLKSCNGFCEICLNEWSDYRRPEVDHCHSTNRVRGIICSFCNKAEGYLFSNPDAAIRLSEYIKRSSSSGAKSPGHPSA